MWRFECIHFKYVLNIVNNNLRQDVKARFNLHQQVEIDMFTCRCYVWQKDGRKRSRLFACHRAYRVGAEIFHITSKTFVQPQIRPPIQRYQVTKPGNYFKNCVAFLMFIFNWNYTIGELIRVRRQMPLVAYLIRMTALNRREGQFPCK